MDAEHITEIKMNLLSSHNLLKQHPNHIQTALHSQKIPGMTPTLPHAVGFNIPIHHSLYRHNRVGRLCKIINLGIYRPNQIQSINQTTYIYTQFIQIYIYLLTLAT